MEINLKNIFNLLYDIIDWVPVNYMRTKNDTK